MGRSTSAKACCGRVSMAHGCHHQEPSAKTHIRRVTSKTKTRLTHSNGKMALNFAVRVSKPRLGSRQPATAGLLWLTKPGWQPLPGAEGEARPGPALRVAGGKFGQLPVQADAGPGSSAHRGLPCGSFRPGLDLNPAAVRPQPQFIAGRVLYSLSSVSAIERAAVLPAPMARITVAAPVTMSPPAHTRGLLVRPFSSVSM